MEKISVCILDNDIHYRDMLVRYMQSYCKDYVIKLLEPDDILRGVTKSYDAVIVDFESLKNIKEDSGIKEDSDIYANKLIVLTSEKGHPNKREDLFLFYRYSCVSELIKYIEKINKKDENIYRIGLEDARLIICFGLSGGAGTTSIATCIASQLSRNRESRVFFISLDTFESETAGSNKKSQEKILYHLIKSDFEDDSDTIISNLVETADGVWRLPASSHVNLIDELDINEKKQYVDKILHGRRFDYVVIDAGSSHDAFTKYLLEAAHNIIISDRYGSRKHRYLSRFEEHLNGIVGSECRIMATVNFVDASASNHQEKSIPIRTYSQTDNEELNDSMEFNADISKITERIG